jgi:hypothetical protein
MLKKKKDFIKETNQEKVYHEIIKELQRLNNNSNREYVTTKMLEESISHYCSRVESKLLEIKVELFKWVIKINLAQTSIIIVLMFALLDFFLK